MTDRAGSFESATARAYDRLADRHPEEFRQLLADELTEPTPPRRVPRATRLGYSRPMRDDDPPPPAELGDSVQIEPQLGEQSLPAGPKTPAPLPLYVGTDRDGKRHAGRQPDVTGYALCGVIITTQHSPAARLGCYLCRETSETR